MGTWETAVMEQKERWDSFRTFTFWNLFYENGKEISVNPYEVLFVLEK